MTVLEMPVGAVRWFIDGVAMLRHADDLHHVSAKLVCKVCRKWGGDGDVRVVERDEGAEVFVACDHRPIGGRVKLGAPLEAQSLLLTLGWGFWCSDCDAPLTGDNDPQGTVFTVTCPCTVREYRLPAA